MTSCGSSHQFLTQQTVQQPVALDYSILEGNYENDAGADEFLGLWNDLLPNKSHWSSRAATLDTYVSLKMLDTKTLQVQLCSPEGEELERMELKGDATPFYFNIKPRVNVVPLLLVYWYSKNPTAIANDANGNLILLQEDYDHTFLLGLESVSAEFIDATYARYDKTQKNPLPMQVKDSLLIKD